MYFNCLCMSAAKSLNVRPIRPHYTSQPILLMHTLSSLSECVVWEVGSGCQCLSINYVRLKLWCQNVSYWLNICKILNETWLKNAKGKKRQTSNTVPYLRLNPRHPSFCFWAHCKKNRLAKWPTRMSLWQRIYEKRLHFFEDDSILRAHYHCNS